MLLCSTALGQTKPQLGSGDEELKGSNLSETPGRTRAELISRAIDAWSPDQGWEPVSVSRIEPGHLILEPKSTGHQVTGLTRT